MPILLFAKKTIACDARIDFSEASGESFRLDMTTYFDTKVQAYYDGEDALAGIPITTQAFTGVLYNTEDPIPIESIILSGSTLTNNFSFGVSADIFNRTIKFGEMSVSGKIVSGDEFYSIFLMGCNAQSESTEASITFGSMSCIGTSVRTSNSIYCYFPFDLSGFSPKNISANIFGKFGSTGLSGSCIVDSISPNHFNTEFDFSCKAKGIVSKDNISIEEINSFCKTFNIRCDASSTVSDKIYKPLMRNFLDIVFRTSCNGMLSTELEKERGIAAKISCSFEKINLQSSCVNYAHLCAYVPKNGFTVTAVASGEENQYISLSNNESGIDYVITDSLL